MPFPLALALPSLAQALPDAPPARVLRLEDAEKIAVQRQPTILQARALTRAAEGRADQAYSGMLPQVTGTASFTHRYTTTSAASAALPTGGGSGTGGPTSFSFDVWSFGVTGTQLIWDFGQTYNRGRAADRTVDAQRTSEETTLVGVVLEVRRAYYQAWAQKALIAVARQTVENDQKHLGQIACFAGVGTRPVIDLVQAQMEAEKLQIRVDVEQAMLNVRAAKATIAATQEAETNARTQLELAEGRYAAGVGSIIELGDAQVATTNAAAQVVGAKLSLAAARAQLDAALGRRA